MVAMIDAENNWEEGLIRQSFMKEDAEAIIKIPLPKENKEHEVLWHFDKKRAIFDEKWLSNCSSNKIP